jgi:hypothetical protein
MSSSKKHKNRVDPSAQPNLSHEETTNRHVYIEPGAQIDFVEDLKKKYEWAQSEERAHSTKQLFWTKVGAALVLIYASIAFWQGYLTRKSAKAAEDANEIARQSLESVQRATVIFRLEVEATGMFNGSRMTSWNFKFPIENTGATPTRGLVDHVNVGTNAGQLPDTFEYPDVNGNISYPSVIGPKETIFTPDLFLEPQVIQDFRDGKKRLFFWGWAKYRDIFKDTPEHITKFCFELVAFEGNPWTGVNPLNPSKIGRSRMSTCPNNNCMDEECTGGPPPHK